MSGGHTHALHVHGHSVVHKLPGHLKVAGLVLFVAAVVATPARAIWAFGLYAAGLALVAGLAGIPARFIGKRMLIEVPFLLFALLLPFVGEAPYVSLAGMRISEAGLLAAWTILAKASCGVVASILLAATTEIPDILAGMNRLRVPTAIVAIAGFMVRYLEVISDEMGRMRVAMAARGYEPKRRPSTSCGRWRSRRWPASWPGWRWSVRDEHFDRRPGPFFLVSGGTPGPRRG